MTTVRIAHTEPWPGRRVGGRGFAFFSIWFASRPADDRLAAARIRKLG